MNKVKVSIAKARDYDCAQVRAALEKAIGLIGGLEDVLKPGAKVFVKINHLPPPSPAERGIVTHPVFVEGVLQLLKDFTTDITVGDDIESGGEDGFRVSGFRQMCERSGVRLINLKEAGFIETYCNGHFLEKIYLSRIALEADIVINLPKLKTHSLTVFTGGVKNMYGTIPNSFRKKFHGEYVSNEDFSHVLTDIFSTVIPQLTIMDGIVAMEGEGPSSGSLRRVGIILASADAVALDAVATKIIGMEPMDIYTTRYSDQRGLGIGNLENIEVVGESITDVSVPDFRPPASAMNALLKKVPRFLSRLVVGQLSVKPQIIEAKCTSCAECERICPTTAISMCGKAAKINYTICIKCMCCHETCRFDAIMPRLSVGGRILYFLNKAFRL